MEYPMKYPKKSSIGQIKLFFTIARYLDVHNFIYFEPSTPPVHELAAILKFRRYFMYP